MSLFSAKLQVTDTDTVLDLMSGWGGFLQYVHEKRGVPIESLAGLRAQLQVTDDAGVDEGGSADNSSTRRIGTRVSTGDYISESLSFRKMIALDALGQLSGSCQMREKLVQAHKLLDDNGLLLLQVKKSRDLKLHEFEFIYHLVLVSESSSPIHQLFAIFE